MFSNRSSCGSVATSAKPKLEKKIPENPKYKHVRPVVDSGKTMRKHIDALRESHKHNVHKMDEVFCRMKLSAFIRLAVEMATRRLSEAQVTADNSSDLSVDGSQEILQIKDEQPVPFKPFQSVLVGIGEIDLKNEQKASSSHISCTEESRPIIPYLLLDVRSKDDFSQCHLITARNYPYTMLCRSPGFETKDLLSYKNAPEKVIILYDEDESLAPRVATTLVQRGYDNLFLLSGGLKLASQKFPHGLLNGALPQPLQSAKSRQDHAENSSYSLQNHVFKNDFTEDDLNHLRYVMDMYCLPARKNVSSKCSTEATGFSMQKSLASSTSTNRTAPWK